MFDFFRFLGGHSSEARNDGFDADKPRLFDMQIRERVESIDRGDVEFRATRIYACGPYDFTIDVDAHACESCGCDENWAEQRLLELRDALMSEYAVRSLRWNLRFHHD